MRQYIFFFLIFLNSHAHGQIILDNMRQKDVNPASSISNILKITQYNALILGTATSCHLPKDDLLIFYNDFFTKIEHLKIEQKEKDNIYKNFNSNFLYKRDTTTPSECTDFIKEFEIIIRKIKEQK